jgi:hypothetical protein
VACHKVKTKADKKIIARSNNARNNSLGIKKRRTITGWRKFNGDIVHAGRDR